jgi:hypothetical protein
MTVVPDNGYGTVSVSLFALPAEGVPVWLFAAGPPGGAAFRAIDLAAAAAPWPSRAP